jgi:hypothetical protein
MADFDEQTMVAQHVQETLDNLGFRMDQFFAVDYQKLYRPFTDPAGRVIVQLRIPRAHDHVQFKIIFPAGKMRAYVTREWGDISHSTVVGEVDISDPNWGKNLEDIIYRS